MRLRFVALFAMSCGLWTDGHAGGGPQNVAVVVNANSWASLAVANEFVKLRHIPPRNMIYLDNVSSFETISIDEFRSTILGPVLKIIEERHLTSQIDYLVYSSDLPYGIDTRGDKPDEKQPYYITRLASITGMTFLHERVEQKDTAYLRLNINRYARWGVLPGDKPLTDEELKPYVKCFELMDEHTTPKFIFDHARPLANTMFWLRLRRALPVLEALAVAHPHNEEVLYNLACCRSRMWQYDEAMAALKASVDVGWYDAYHTAEDDDLTGLRKRQDFKDLLEALKQVVVEPKPACAFRSSIAWNDKCEPSDDGKGDHYLLSTMLAVTSGRGVSVTEALNDLDRAAQSDGTHPTGSIYYLLNGDVRSTTRRWAFRSAVHLLDELGVKAAIVDGVLPQEKPDVMGAMVGIADFDWEKSGSTILPGAICEHLTSYGGALRQYEGQTPCTVFMRNGAAGTSGAVEEPYAMQQKFPTPFIQVFYARGCSLAESFYQSVSGPYQLIVIGDPLCAPWKSAPTVTLDGVKANDVVKGTLTLHPNAPAADARAAVGSFELFVNGLRQGAAAPGSDLSLDTTALPDGYHELEVVGIVADRVATQGRILLPVVVNNHGKSIELTADQPKISWDGTIRLHAKMLGAKAIRIEVNGRTVGRVDGEDGAIDVNARLLGLGAVSVQAYGSVDANDAVAAISAPISITVDPAWIAAAELDKAANKKGVLITLDDGTAKVAEPSRDGKWLSAAGLTRGHVCTLDAWFNAPADELYQFQIHSPLTLSINVDGAQQQVAVSDAWQFVPLAMRKGAHHFRIKIDAAKADPNLDLRFGASGTHSVEGNQFKCVAAEH